MKLKPDQDLISVPTLAKFARKYSLRRAVLTDSCGEQIVVLGRPPKPRPEDCSHIFEHSDSRLGVCLLFHSTRAWNNARDRCLASGMELTQDGETEGILLFNPENPTQAKLAMKESKARVQRVLSEKEHQRRVVQVQSLRRGSVNV